MPCYTPPHAYCHHDENALDELICEVSEKIKVFSMTKEYASLKELKQYADKVTEMLCRIMNNAIVMGSGKMVLDINVDSDIKDWFHEHQKWDQSHKDKE